MSSVTPRRAPVVPLAQFNRRGSDWVGAAQRPRWFGLAMLAAAGCGAPRPNVAPQSPQVAALHQGPLTDLVPAAGLRWMVVAKPKQLLYDSHVARSTEQLFPSKRLQAFAQGSGVDLRTLESGCIAGFDLGTLYLAETKTGIGVAQQAFVDRLMSEPVIKHPGAGVTHITGIVGTTPESFVALDGIGLGLSVKDPTLTKIAGAFALGKLHKSPSALKGAALRELPAELAQFPIQFYAPGPFSEQWAKGAEGLLGQTLAVAVVAKPNTDGSLRIEVIAAGDYGEDLPLTNQKARQSFQNLAQSDLGRLLGFASETLVPEVIAESRQLTLRLSVPLQRLMDGLFAAVAADATDLLELPRKPTSVPQTGTSDL